MCQGLLAPEHARPHRRKMMKQRAVPIVQAFEAKDLQLAQRVQGVRAGRVPAVRLWLGPCAYCAFH